MASALDFGVIVIYLAITLWIGIRAARGEHLSGYLVNNRRTSLWLMTFSNVSTIVGAGGVVGVAAAAYVTGISYGLTMLIALIGAIILIALCAARIKSFGDSTKAFTLGDYFANRYGPRYRTISSILLVGLLLIWSSVQFSAISGLLSVLLGIDFAFALIGAVIITILYTSLAGIKSDLLTDFWQFWVIGLMFAILIPFAWSEAGGFLALSQLPPSKFDMNAFGGIAFVIGGIFTGLFGLISNVSHWQRIYSADSISTAKRSFWISIPFVAIFIGSSILAGLFASILVPGLGPEQSFFALMDHLLPSGLLGMAYAGILAVAMSSVDSYLIGGSATILKDIYMPWLHPAMHEHELLNLARYITAIFGILGAGVAFIFNDIVFLSILTLSVSLLFVPSILGGLFWKRVSSHAAMGSLVVGLIVLVIVLPLAPKVAFFPSFVCSALGLVILTLIFPRRQAVSP